MELSNKDSNDGMNTITEPWEQEFDDFDSLLDEEALIALDNSCKEENMEEIVVISDGEEEPVKTLQEIADEEEKDVYDPAILGMNFSLPFSNLYLSSSFFMTRVMEVMPL